MWSLGLHNSPFPLEFFFFLGLICYSSFRFKLMLPANTWSISHSLFTTNSLKGFVEGPLNGVFNRLIKDIW